MNSPYSPLKIFHHREWLNAVSKGEQPAPIFVQVIPTNRCNQHCEHCAYRLEGYSSNQCFSVRDQLSREKLLEIVSSCKELGVKAVEVTGGGEPTLHPDFLVFCKTILAVDIDLGIVTNGALWTTEHTQVLKDAAWVRFSIDAGNDKTYAMLRASTSKTYFRVRDAINSLAQLNNPPLIGVSFVVTDKNWREVEEAADNAYEDGANNFRISAVFQDWGAEYFKDFKVYVDEACARIAERYHGTRFKVFNLFTDRLGDLTQGSPDYSFCGFQQASTYIGADYNVYRCCVLAYNGRGLLGSIRDRSFAELWQSEEKQRLIDDFDARGCPRCMFNNKNVSISYALCKNPLHVNFV